jgi:D-3-phosphoglycerate dehydrogenase
MKVIGYDPFLAASAFPEEIEKIDDWDEIFRTADFISVHIPATPETRDSISVNEFGLMKETAYFINAARGEVVDEAALISALEKGQIAGAGLDVFDPEPPAKDNPLFKMENVILTPHNAALTAECMKRMALHAAQGIHDVLSGAKPQWPVNNPAKPRA